MELFFDLRLRTFVSKVLKLICFSVFFHSGGAAWGPWAQATPGMNKTEKQISLRTFDTKVLNLRSKQ